MTAILGGHQTDFARNIAKQDQDVGDLTREAVEATLADAGIDATDVESVLASVQGFLERIELLEEEVSLAVRDLRGGFAENRGTFMRSLADRIFPPWASPFGRREFHCPPRRSPPCRDSR